MKEVKKNTERRLHRWDFLPYISMLKILGRGDEAVGRNANAHSVCFLLLEHTENLL